MSVLALLFLGTLVIIYGSSYFELRTANQKILERYAATYSLKEHPKEGFGFEYDMVHGNTFPDMEGPMDKDKRRRVNDIHTFKLSTFYSVAVSDEGEILAADIADETFYEKDKLVEYAMEILEDEKEKGIKGNLIYLVSDKGGYTLVAFMDNTIMRGSMMTLFRYTLIFGSVTIAALFFVAIYLAKRIVKPLEESYRKQKQFISDAGHELKTPVSVISANAELLSRELGDNQWLANIQYENERMGKLVIQLLELTRTETIALQTEHLDFSRLVDGETLPFESVAFEKGLVLKCDIESDLFIEGNANQLKQLVSILLDNAICHSTDGKEIFLTLRASHKHVILSVANAGKPIPAEQIEQMFGRFYRADTVRNGDDRHYGLGLSIAKTIVTAHKGRIEVGCHDGLVEFKVILAKYHQM
ncbi:MAG: HAMP domain-containing histidine kinase [Lachnospiraceae bacterium]|nr:HAMP domain-containing histidine kinase [Lachnospiraceae bacterium]